MSAGVAVHVNVNVDVDIDAGAASTAAAGHFVKLGRCQLDKFAKVIHS
jgi:hypothetical protein